MNCWGWATWGDRWKNYRREPSEIIKVFDKKEIFEFDISNSGLFWSQVIDNITGKSNTWAIFWYATIFKNKGLCLNPSISYSENIGLDNSGTNSTRTNQFNHSYLNSSSIEKYPDEIVESSIALNRIVLFFKSQKKSLIKRASEKVIRILEKFV